MVLPQQLSLVSIECEDSLARRIGIVRVEASDVDLRPRSAGRNPSLFPTRQCPHECACVLVKRNKGSWAIIYVDESAKQLHHTLVLRLPGQRAIRGLQR